MVVEFWAGLAGKLSYDVLKHIFGEGYNEKLDFQKMSNALLNQSYSNSILDTHTFEDVVSSQPITGLLKNYFIYSSTIKGIDEIDNSIKPLNIQHANLSGTRSSFIESISNLTVEHLKARDSKSDIELVKEFFKELVNNIEEKLKDYLGMTSISSQYFMRVYLSEMEERLTRKISPITYVDINDNKDIATYKNIIATMFEKFELYGYKNDLTFDQFYIDPRIGLANSSKDNESTEFPIKDIFAATNIVSIIGGPGYGKTLFLKKLAADYKELSCTNAAELIPIFCNLKDYDIYMSKEINPSMVGFLQYSMITKTGICKSKITTDLIESILLNGRALILMDALDEVKPEIRKNLNDTIIGFYSHVNKDNKIIISTRDRSLIPKTKLTFKILPLNNSEVDKYISKQIEIGLFSKKDKSDFLRQSVHLIDINFMQNYLILSLLVNVFKCEKKLPETKLDLYDKCTKYIVLDREYKEKISEESKNTLRSFLKNDSVFQIISELCFPSNRECTKYELEEMFKEKYTNTFRCPNDLDNAIEEFTEFCNLRTELFVAATDEKFKFFHRSFFDFFYAKRINSLFTNVTEFFKTLSKIEDDSEIIELSMAQLHRDSYDRNYRDFVDFLEKRLESDYTEVELRLYIHALLVGEEEKRIERLLNLLCQNPFVFFEQIAEHYIPDLEKLFKIAYETEQLNKAIFESMKIIVLQIFATANDLVRYPLINPSESCIDFITSVIDGFEDEYITHIYELSGDEIEEMYKPIEDINCYDDYYSDDSIIDQQIKSYLNSYDY